MPRAPRGFVFDLFHTLTGMESEWSDVPSTCQLLGLDYREWDQALVAHSRWRLVGAERDPFTVMRRLVDVLDPSIPDARVREAVDCRIRRFHHALRRIPEENLRTLRRLREAGLRLALLSNADALEIASWPGSSLCGLFDVEMFSCDAGCAKPEPEIFSACFEALGLPGSDCVFVGDGGSDELVGARQAGMRTVFFSGVIQSLFPERVEARERSADHHIRRIPEILALFALDRPVAATPSA
jgi:putative hydrolase of the HAD superfamily